MTREIKSIAAMALSLKTAKQALTAANTGQTGHRAADLAVSVALDDLGSCLKIREVYEMDWEEWRIGTMDLIRKAKSR